jgi:soluble lytic murein transglycosylase-like protein
MKSDINITTSAETKSLNQTGSRSFSTKEKEKIKTAAVEFQAVMINQMLKTMRQTELKDEDQGDTLGEDIYTELFDMQISKSISANGKFGIAEMIYKQMTGEELTIQKTVTSEKNIIKRSIDSNNSSVNVESKKVNSTSGNVINNVNKFEDIINSASKRQNVSSNLIKAVIAAESGGNSKATSQANAKGLMQLIDSTADDLGVTDSFNPVQNINGGTKYLKELLNKYNGNIDLTLAAYNAGPGAVDKYNGVPPYKETKNYIQEVKKYLNIFKVVNNTELAQND